MAVHHSPIVDPSNGIQIRLLVVPGFIGQLGRFAIDVRLGPWFDPDEEK
jgi:hypothetical protein